MFPIDPNAPGGPDRSDSLRRSYLDHTLVREHLSTFTVSQANPLRASRSVLSGRPAAAGRQSGRIPGAEPVRAQQSMGSRAHLELTVRPSRPVAR
jgi:hypothetical protein